MASLCGVMIVPHGETLFLYGPAARQATSVQRGRSLSTFQDNQGTTLQHYAGLSLPEADRTSG